MTTLEPGLHVRIEEFGDGPRPFPLVSGFSMGQAYRALGLSSPSESSDAYFVLSNDNDEICLISNCHVRAYALLPDECALKLPIRQTSRKPLIALQVGLFALNRRGVMKNDTAKDHRAST